MVTCTVDTMGRMCTILMGRVKRATIGTPVCGASRSMVSIKLLAKTSRGRGVLNVGLHKDFCIANVLDDDVLASLKKHGVCKKLAR